MGPPDEDRKHALDLWRGGERLLRRKVTPGWVTEYEHAVALALAHLQRYTTLDDLVQAYFGDSHVSDPEDWLAAARHTQSGRALNQGIVEDVAYWRRAQQLIAAVTQ